MSTPIEARIRMRARLRELLDGSEIINGELRGDVIAREIDRLSDAAIEIVVQEVRDLASELYSARKGARRDG